MIFRNGHSVGAPPFSMFSPPFPATPAGHPPPAGKYAAKSARGQCGISSNPSMTPGKDRRNVCKSENTQHTPKGVYAACVCMRAGRYQKGGILCIFCATTIMAIRPERP